MRLLIVLGTVLLHVAAQPQIGQSEGNECRHTAILSRTSPKDTRSTNCFQTIRLKSRSDFTLRGTVDKGALWTLDHNGSITGQLVHYAHGAVHMLSMKSCLDYGASRGFPIVPFYTNLSEPSSALLGDFNFTTKNADIYESCTKNKTPFSEFLLKKSADDPGVAVPPNATRFMRVHVAKHEGEGSILVPYKFSYDADALERAFQDALRAAVSSNSSKGKKNVPSVTSGEPFLLNGFSFENGHSLVAPEDANANGRARKDLVQDLYTVAYNRLQESVASYAGRDPPQPLLPEAISSHDLLTITVLAFVSIFTFHHALVAAAKAGRERVRQWKTLEEAARWTYVSTPEDHKSLALRTAPRTRHELYAAVFMFIAAVVGIAGAVLTFWTSNIRYRDFLLIRQGFLVTYGPSDPAEWAVDKDNLNAGAVFVAGHWFVAQKVEVGYRRIFQLIIAVYAGLTLILFASWYKFSTLREHRLDNGWLQKVIQVLRAIVQTALGLVAFSRMVPSYKNVFRRSRKDLSDHFYVNVQFEAKVHCDKLWDGRIDVGLLAHPSEGLEPPDGNHIERAAAFLTSDRFGRLSYPQALALLSNAPLLRAADRYRNGKHPSVDELLQFSRLYSIKGVLLPEASTAGLSQGQLSPVSDRQLTEDEEFAVKLTSPECSADNPSGMYELFRVRN